MVHASVTSTETGQGHSWQRGASQALLLNADNVHYVKLYLYYCIRCTAATQLLSCLTKGGPGLTETGPIRPVVSLKVVPRRTTGRSCLTKGGPYSAFVSLNLVPCACRGAVLRLPGRRFGPYGGFSSIVVTECDGLICRVLRQCGVALPRALERGGVTRLSRPRP